MKTFKTIKLAIISFLIGQSIALYFKDKEYRKEIETSKLSDKFFLWFTSIIELNKKWINNIWDYNYQEKIGLFIAQFEEEKYYIEEKIVELKEKWEELSADTIKPILEDLEIKLLTLKDNAQEFISDLNDNYQLEEKIEKIKNKICILKNKIKE